MRGIIIELIIFIWNWLYIIIITLCAKNLLSVTNIYTFHKFHEINQSFNFSLKCFYIQYKSSNCDIECKNLDFSVCITTSWLQDLNQQNVMYQTSDSLAVVIQLWLRCAFRSKSLSYKWKPIIMHFNQLKPLLDPLLYQNGKNNGISLFWHNKVHIRYFFLKILQFVAFEQLLWKNKFSYI